MAVEVASMVSVWIRPVVYEKLLVFCGIRGSKLYGVIVGFDWIRSDQIGTLDKTRQDVTLAGSGRTIVCCVCGISLVKPALFSAWIKRVKSIEVVKNPLKKRRQENQNNSPDKKCPLEEQAGLQSHSRTPQELFSRPRNPTGVLWEVSCKNRNPPPSHSKGCGVCKTKLSEAHYMQRLPETGKAAGSCSASSGCKWTPHYTELVPVKHWLALSAEYAFHSVPYLNPAYLPISIKKKSTVFLSVAKHPNH